MTDEQRPRTRLLKGRPPAGLESFARAFDHSPSCVFLVGPNGNLSYVNSSFSTATGRPATQLIGANIASFGHTKSSPIWLAIETKRPWQGQLSMQVDGQTCAGSASLTPILNRNGVCQFMLCTCDGLHEPLARVEPISPASPLVLVVDLDGTILFIDRTVPGVSREEAIGASIYAYMPAEHHERIRAYLREVVETRGSLSYQVPSIGPYGAVLKYQTHVGPIERDGEVVALSFVSWEVTEEALEVEDRYRVLAEAGMEGLIIYERNVIIDANHAVCQMFGDTANDLIGQPVAKLFAPRSRSMVRKDSFYQTGEIHQASGLRNDGASFAIEVCGKSLPHPSGLSTVIEIRDISTRRRATRARQASPRARRSAPAKSKASPERESIELSGRELDVLELLAQGMTNREVADRIRVSARTVDHHVSHILSKLGARNRTAAAMAARRKGLLR